MNQVLFIHGIAQGGRGAAAVRAEWLGALRYGYTEAGLAWPGDEQFSLAYYADDLDEVIAQSSSTSFTAKSSGTPSDPFEEFSAHVLSDMVDGSPLLSDELIAREFEQTSAAGEKSIQNWGWVRAIAKAIDRHTRLDNALIETFLKEVHYYVNLAHVATMVDAIIDRELTRPTVLVGHSLGSVVSYRATTRHGEAKIRGHVTLGSPLAIKSIRGTLGLTKNVAHSGWFNGRDAHDIVALYPLDDSHFLTSPSIVDDSSLENETDNQHGISGYLNKPSVAAAIEAARTA